MRIITSKLNDLRNAAQKMGIAAGLRIINIDRTQPFDANMFLKEGGTIDEQDKLSLNLTRINLSNVLLEHMIGSSDTAGFPLIICKISGEEKLRRLKEAGFIRMDAMVLKAILENQSLIPGSWKQEKGFHSRVFFDGTVIKDRFGKRLVPYIYWDGDQWILRYYGLDNQYGVLHPSAVLPAF